MVPNGVFLKAGGRGLEEPGEPPLSTNLGLCFDAFAGCLCLSRACHAQGKQSKPDLAGG